VLQGGKEKKKNHPLPFGECAEKKGKNKLEEGGRVVSLEGDICLQGRPRDHPRKTKNEKPNTPGGKRKKIGDH